MRKFLLCFLINLGFFMNLSGYIVLKEVVPGWVFIVDSKGFIYTNFGENEIRKFSPEGKLIQKIGRKGQGPGDILRLGSFAINPKDGNIYVTEWYRGNRKVSIFSLEGKYVGEWRIDLDWKYWQGLGLIKFDKFGNGYIFAAHSDWKRYKDFMLSEEEQIITKFDYEGKKRNELCKIRVANDCDKGGKGEITIPFTNNLFFDVLEDKIAIKEAINDYVSIFDLNGKEVQKVYLPFKKEKVSQKDIEEWTDWMKPWGKRAGLDPDFLDYWKSRMPFPEYKPISTRVYFDGKGNLFIKKFTGYKSKGSVWIRVNISTGEYKIKELENENIIFIDKDWVYLSRESEEGEEVVIKMKREEFGL